MRVANKRTSKFSTRSICLLAGSIAALAGPIGASSEDAPASTPHFRLGPDRLRTVEQEQETPPKSPAQFNPDPGSWDRPRHEETAPDGTDWLFPDGMPGYRPGPLPASQRLPRGAVLGRDPITKAFTYREYPLGREGLGLLPYSKAWPSRWPIPFPHWTRYHDPTHETPYMYETPRLWHPYEQSYLKGDVPIIGQDIFADITAKNFSMFEYRRLPVPSGVSTAQPNASEFFGRGEQVFFTNDTSIAVDLFKGETAFKPVSWLFHVNFVHNENWLSVREDNLIDVDPRGDGPTGRGSAPNTSLIQAGTGANASGKPVSFRSTVNPGDVFNYIAPQLQPTGSARPLVKVDPKTQEIPAGKKAPVSKSKSAASDTAGSDYTVRHRDFNALQEAFGEIHFGDISDNYDFIAGRFGIQPFVSDFRGFIFADTNLGARVFGNADNNRTQYNVAFFDMREKDTNSDLNSFESRHQHVLIANVFRQDFLWKGYTAQVSFHTNLDDASTHYDRNGFLNRPAPLGTVPQDKRTLVPQGHDINAYYLGWTGDGHIDRFNVTHAFYEVLGHDGYDQLSGHGVDINAQMAALELSYDNDWFRVKLSGFYASGNDNPTGNTAHGFDSIQDNPQFIGGPFSWYVHQGFNLAGTGVNFKQRDSLVPDLRSSKTEGQSNFNNPGVLIAGLGTDVDLTPKLKAFVNANYIWLATPKPIEYALQTNAVRTDLGLDTSIGFKYRPLLTDNIIFSAGVGFFVPGGGYRDIYRNNTVGVPGYTGRGDAGKTDSYLYNVFATVTLVY